MHAIFVKICPILWCFHLWFCWCNQSLWKGFIQSVWCLITSYGHANEVFQTLLTIANQTYDPLHMAWIFIPSFGVEYVGLLFFLTHTSFVNKTWIGACVLFLGLLAKCNWVHETLIHSHYFGLILKLEHRFSIQNVVNIIGMIYP